MNWIALLMVGFGLSVVAAAAYESGRRAARREILEHWAQFTCPVCLAAPRAWLMHHSGCDHGWTVPVDVGLPPPEGKL